MMKISMLKEFVNTVPTTPAPLVAKKPAGIISSLLDTKSNPTDNNRITGQPLEQNRATVSSDDKSFTYGLDPVEDEETIKDIKRYKRTLPHLYHKLTNLD